MLAWFYFIVPDPIITFYGYRSKNSVFFFFSLVLLLSVLIPIAGYYRYKKAVKNQEKIIEFSWFGSGGIVFRAKIRREDYMFVVSLFTATIDVVPISYGIFLGLSTINGWNIQENIDWKILYLLAPIIFFVILFLVTVCYYDKKSRI